jgi:hypothetical protein
MTDGERAAGASDGSAAQQERIYMQAVDVSSLEYVPNKLLQYHGSPSRPPPLMICQCWALSRCNAKEN